MKCSDAAFFRSGPAVIVYNERGHRIEDEDLDVYPEDDQSYQTSRSERRGGDGTPINQYPPPAAGSGSRRDSSFPQLDPIRIEKSSSRGYPPSAAPSIAPSTSHRSTADRSMYSGSDSERRKGKDREYEDRASVTPVDNSRSAYGQSPISRGASSAAPDTYSATWGGGVSAQSPSIRPPNSRSVSFYDSQPASAVDPRPTNQAWGPESGVDDHHESYKWDNPSPQHVAQLNVILDRPRSPFGSTQAPDPPEGRPKSAFGDPAPSAFGNGPPPAMFGDNGPAAYTGEPAGVSAAGASTAIFGEPPASVFGQNAGGGETGVSDSWGFPAAAATTPVTTPGKKSKKKNSAIGTPVSGLASRTSPAAGPKSPFGDGASGGLLSSKAPSPYDKGKPLSPLNPASQMNNDQGTEPNNDNWGFESGHQGGNSGWGTVNLDEPPREPSRAPSPVPPVQPMEPLPEEPTAGKKKKKKTTSAAAGAFASEADDARRNQEEKEAQEREESRLAKEEQQKQAEEKKRQESEAAQSTGAHESLFGNSTNYFPGAISSSLSLNPSDKPWLSTDTGGGDDSWGAASKKKKGKGGAATDAAAKESGGLGSFGSSWGFSGGLSGSFGADAGGGAATDEPTQQQSSFNSFGSSWGYGAGMGSNFEADTGGGAAATDSAGLFDFAGSSGPNLGFSISSENPPSGQRSRAGSPTFGATEGESNHQNLQVPGDIAEGVSGGEGAGGAEAGTEDKKKKKKGKKSGFEPTAEDMPPTPAAEDPVGEVPTAAPEQEEDSFSPVPVSASKKKKKKK